MAEVVKVVTSVSSALVKLAALLLKKYEELQAVRGQIEQMEKELLFIQALLRDADSKLDKKELVTLWLNEVREIANTVATVIDTFRHKIEENHAESSNSFKKFTTKITKAFKRSYKTYMLDLPGELERITKKLNWIYQRGIQLGIKDDLRTLDGNVDDAEPSDDVDDPEVVGLEDDQGKIIEQLLDSSISRRTVLSIVGTGGLGKTTLVQKVYNSAKLEGQFKCRAWLTISQEYNLNDLLRKILYSVDPRMKKENPPVTDIPMMLKSSLRHKRYLIVLDDVWTTDVWEELKKKLPDPNNASRIIITSRSNDVAKAADCNTKPYKLRYLSDAEGLALLFRNAFQQHVQPENYPHLLDVAKRLMKKCGGLPLALIVLGGILTRRDQNYTAWNMLDETMDWHGDDGKKCSQVLAKSYEDLPKHLKSCFLYFAAYPEDYNISGRQVTRMWMAEEFIPKDGAGTIEDRAEKCLEELVIRCLIQVTKKSWNGYCKYCNMHDLIRNLAITKAQGENFFTVFSKQGKDVNQLAATKPCRAALQFSTLAKDGVYSENTRSLLCFTVFGDCGLGKLNYPGFRLLRVLNFERVYMAQFPQRQWPKNLIHLRYLGLRYCKIPYYIIMNLSFYKLETIDLKGSEISCETTDDETKEIIYDVIIPTLRHVRAGEFYLPLKWDQHTNLQTVEYTMKRIQSVVEIGCCINLRTLVIRLNVILDDERALKEWQNLKDVLRRTEQLVYLCIFVQDGFLPFGGTTNLPCHGKIQKLSLGGLWVRDILVSSVEMFPTNLTKLILEFSKLMEDPMPILERLQSLRILHLGYKSYVGTELICSTGGFPNLEKLELIYLPYLCHWDIKEGAMPILTHLKISGCDNLYVLPNLQKVQTLQELQVIYPSHELHESMQGKDLHKIKHIPSVQIERNPCEDED